MKRMTLDEYIKELKDLKRRIPAAGKLPIIYATDDEGNGFGYVESLPQVAEKSWYADVFNDKDVPDTAVLVN